MNWQGILLLQLVFGYSVFKGCFSQKRIAATVEISKLGNSFIGKVHIEGVPTEINLKTTESNIFAPNFRLIEPAESYGGELRFNDITPSPEVIQELEQSFYVDQGAGAVFKLHHADGEYRLHGIMNNVHISHDGEKHFAIAHENEGKYATPLNIPDHLVQRDQPQESEEERVTRQTTSVTRAAPEVFIVTDYLVGNSLNFTNSTIMEYCAIMMTAVNNRYATITDPVIVFQITGLLYITKRSDQQFIEVNKIPNDNAYDLGNTLTNFSQYMWNIQNQTNVAKHDLASLFSGEYYKNKTQQSGYKNYTDYSGLAWVGGACLFDNRNPPKSLKTALIQDQGGCWNGSNTAAHELAHNLGSPHDGDGNSSSCPWTDGYIMSYLGGGNLSKFYFSNCSKVIMKSFIDGAGKCVKENNASSSWAASSVQPGDRLNLTMQCKKFLNRTDVTVVQYNNADNICRNLNCTYQAPCPAPNQNRTCIWWTQLNRYSLDNSLCNATSGARCKNGYCVK